MKSIITDRRTILVIIILSIVTHLIAIRSRDLSVRGRHGGGTFRCSIAHLVLRLHGNVDVHLDVFLVQVALMVAFVAITGEQRALQCDIILLQCLALTATATPSVGCFSVFRPLRRQ